MLKVFAALFALLAVSNLLKPFGLEGEETGFVLLGRRLSGMQNAVVAPVFGVFLLTYAAGIWRMKRYALSTAYVYAAYVILNLILFSFRTPQHSELGYLIFGVVYSVLAIGGSCWAAYLLYQRRAELT
jgi:hypothetical protein